MSEHDIPYFRSLWQKNVLNLENCCEEWEKICSISSVPDDVLGEIRTVIGLARLLMNQKLKQFKGLIDDSEFHTGEKEITCSDLEGFWDMVHYEVKKIENSFQRLIECKNKNWKFEEKISENFVKKIPVKKNIAALNKKTEVSKAQVLAARQRIAEIKKKMAAQHKGDKYENQIDIILPNPKEHAENNTENEAAMNIAVLSNKSVSKESYEKRKSNRVSNKINVHTEANDLQESSELNSAFKVKSVQKKKYTTSNKENLFSDDPSDLKHTPTKQTKFNETVNQELKKSKTKPDIGKLQCVTRSAAKKALLLQQN